MKMSSIFKKASVFAIAATMVLLMVVSVLPAALADSSTAGLDFGEKLVSSDISIAGGITMKYYFELPEENNEFDKPDCIKISYPNQGGSLITDTYNIANLAKDGKYYLVEVPVSFAQQAETITMQWYKGEECSKKVFKKTVRNYADTVFKYANIDLEQYPQYAQLKEDCQALLPTITNMLNAGALAQISCNYKATDPANLANYDWFGIGTNPVDNMLASHFYAVEGSGTRNDKYEDDNKDSGVTFTGTEIFLTSKVTMRVYIDCPDDVTTAEVYKYGESKSQTVAIKTDTSKDGAQRRFIVIKNIAPTAFNTRFRVEVTGDKVAKFESSVLDYAYDTVNSTFASEERKDTAKALYLFYAYIKTYAGDSVVVDPNECNHDRSYYFAKLESIVCPDCGDTYPEETVKVLVTTKGTTRIRHGETGKLTLTYAIAGNTKFNSLLIVPSFPAGISWTVDSVTYSDGFSGEAGRNFETDNLFDFESAQFATVTYKVTVGENAALGVNQIGFSVKEAILAEGGEFNSKVDATPVSIEVLPKLCETHGNVKYIIDGDYHYAYCKDCFYSEYVEHNYESGYKMANGKIVCYSKICACGIIHKDSSTSTYDAGFELGENDSKINKAPLFLLTPADIAAKKFTDLGDVVLSEEDGISFVTIHNNTEVTTEGSFYILDANTKVTGRYLAIKYRTTTTSGSEFFVGANNKNAAEEGDNTSSEGDNTSSQGENFCIAPGAVYVNNGEWHVMILDLAKINPSSFIANEDGTYTADHIRWDIFNDAKDTDQTVDIAYIAMSDDIMSVASFDGNDYYRVSTGVDDNKAATPDYMASTVTLNVVADAEWISYVPHSGGSNRELLSNSEPDGLKYAHITRKGTAADCYLYITNIDNTGEISHYAHTTQNAKYFAVIYRTDNKDHYHEAWVGTSSLKRFVDENIFRDSDIGDGEWHIQVVNMGDIATEYYDPTTGLATLRFDYWNRNTGEEGKWIADFAFFGVFDSEESAYEYCGNYLKEHNVECAHDSVTGWQFISNAGTEYEGTRYAVEAKKCTLCGEVVETRSAVIAVNFGITIDQEDGTNSTFTWGTSNYLKAGDMSLRETDNETLLFLRDNKTISGSGWAGINGSYSTTAYYRVLDKDGKVLLNWTETSITKKATETAIQDAVDYQIGAGTLDADSNASRFTIEAIDLSAYASRYQDANSTPITLEYAFKAEGAPEGSDLVMVVKFNNIYKTCTEHKWHSITKPENGKLTVSTECANCGKTNGSYEMAIGNKAPNLFIGAGELAYKVATNSAKIDTNYTLSDDGSYVTIKNAGTGDGYINIFSGNTTVTGRYVVIKYRTANYTGSSDAANYGHVKVDWEIFTASNASGTTPASNTKDNFKLFETSNQAGANKYETGTSQYKGYSPRSNGGIVADGEWHYTVIDLAGVNAEAFKPYDDGTYRAQYFRWDLFDVTKNNASIDVAYIAFAEDITTLTDMDNMVEYKYAYTRYDLNASVTAEVEAAVIPMSATTGANNPFYDASHLAIKGAGKNGVLTFDAETGMPYARFTTTGAGAEDYFDVWNCAYKIGGSGKYVGILYRASSNSNATSFEVHICSNNSSAGGKGSKTVSITSDGQWRFAFVDVSTVKSSSYYYDASSGVQSMRFDVFNDKKQEAGATIDVAFVGLFDGMADLATTLSTYNELYGLALDIPTYITLSNIGGTIQGVNYESAIVNNTALKTSTSYLGQIYISGRVAIAGAIKNDTTFVYRLLDADGNVLPSEDGDEWRGLVQYKTNTIFNDVSSTSHLSTAQKSVPGVTSVYEYCGLADIRQFPGQTVTVECALIIEGVDGGEDIYYTFMAFTNVKNTQTP